MSVKLGKAKNQVAVRKNYFSLKDGDSVFMILPPLGDLAEKGQWSKYHTVHFGYSDSSGKLKTFGSTEVINYKTKMVEVPDAAMDRIKQLDDQLLAATKSRNTEETKRLMSLKKKYNADKKHYLNVMTLDGQLGLLKIPHKSMEVLKQEIKRQESSGIDVMDPDNGRFMVFRRSGTGRDTSHQVLTYKEKIKVEGLGEVEKEKVAKLDDSIMARLESEVSLDLNKVVRYITSDEIEAIVEADKRNDFSVIDSIFGKPNQQEEAPEMDEDEQIDAPVSAVTQETKAETKTDLSSAVKLGAASKETKTKAAAASSVSEMTDDEFLANMLKG